MVFQSTIFQSTSALPAFRTPLRAAHNVLVGLIALALAGCDLKAEETFAQPPPQVDVAEVVVRNIAGWDEFTGRISAVETVQLRPRVGGYIERVLFTEGQEVARGDVLFEIDARSYRAAFAQARAELARVRSQADLARIQVDRALRLAESRAISNEDLDQRKAAATQADADVLAAEARLDAARLELDHTRVRAPIDGRAGRALVTAGNLAAPDSTVLTTLVSLHPVHVHFEADERTFLRYQKVTRANGGNGNHGANPVHVGLAGETGFPHRGVLDFLDNQLDAGTGTIRARAVLDNADRAFTPGLFARVRLLDTTARPVVLIDDKAILTDQDRKYVYLLGADGTARRRDVTPGRAIDGLRIIETGLGAGDQVVVNGMQRIFFHGMPIDPQPVANRSPALVATTR